MTQSLAIPRHGTAHEDAAQATVREKACAKVNLTLHVLGKRPDGYHELESLAVFADICDELSFTPASPGSLSLEGPFAGAVDGENLVLKAKRAVAAWLGREICGDFRLAKNLPVAAGLGGGSSDAAAAIRILLKVYGGSLRVEDFIAKSAAIGADVPVCLYHKAAWMRGLGERITPAPDVSALPAVLVNPRVKLSTAEVFKRLNAGPYNAGGGGELASADFTTPESAALSLQQGRNDLEPPAIALEPAVATVLDTLRRQDGCLLARLSGSGPTCFGLFPSQAFAVRAADAIAGAYPHWWVVATTLS
ncbi:MAG: 4-(cytidine 5'-diphospho)-2-C-methyl-D-erythritol kinase [Rhodomicrobium sp.]|nr:4-(cytidine 5'-diphospho)-2-C-methyl-D-erythritol kinase [Rhodomicrobium sp.]